jgi:uncharacterized protein YvpB
MATGWQKVNDCWYYLNANGAMTSGWQLVNGRWYLLAPSGEMYTGWQFISNSWFYLDQSGAMATGWLQSGNEWYYLLADGRMATGRQWIDGSWQDFLNNGVWQADYVLFNASTVNQNALGVHQGCEPAALWAGLNWKGYANNLGYLKLVAEMPISFNGNPYENFGGNPYYMDDDPRMWGFPAIFPGPFTNWAKRYASAENISGADGNRLRQELRANNPVVVWVTVDFNPPVAGNLWFGSVLYNNHAVLLDGFDAKNCRYHVADSISGNYWISETRFEAAYNARRFAVAIR